MLYFRPNSKNRFYLKIIRKFLSYGVDNKIVNLEEYGDLYSQAYELAIRDKLVRDNYFGKLIELKIMNVKK